ncbi:MAG: aminotransferase class IV [candidate division Zixibacteria bacterium]|nr:aminotransferase class IV [candidate division Zixibacteria bacterium]
MTSRRTLTVTTINGKQVSGDGAKISVLDNALLYAEGLFETFLACDDRVLFLDEHLDRLYRGAKVIDLTPPVSRDKLARWMKATVAAHPARIKKLRLTITSGEARRWTGIQGKPQVILLAASHTIPTEPFRLQVSDFRVDQDSEFRRIKTISYAVHAAALKRALHAGFDDALMINQKNRVAEVTSANIFWRRGRTVYTPPLSAGCLEGVTRHVVLNGAKSHGVRIVEKTEPLEHMITADEVFITSSLKLVIGVSEIVHGRKRYHLAAGDTTRQLAEWLRHVAGI